MSMPAACCHVWPPVVCSVNDSYVYLHYRVELNITRHIYMNAPAACCHVWPPVAWCNENAMKMTKHMDEPHNEHDRSLHLFVASI